MSKRKSNYKNRQNRQKRRKRREQSENDSKSLSSPPPISPTVLISILVIQFILKYFNFLVGKEEKPRIRKDLDKDVFDPLGDYYICRAYRMSRDSFDLLHDILEPKLKAKFFPKNGGTRDIEKNSYLIKTRTRLAIAIRYFAGGSPYDIMLTHGVSFSTVFSSVYGVIDCVNECEELAFQFPSKSR